MTTTSTNVLEQADSAGHTRSLEKEISKRICYGITDCVSRVRLRWPTVALKRIAKPCHWGLVKDSLFKEGSGDYYDGAFALGNRIPEGVSVSSTYPPFILARFIALAWRQRSAALSANCP